MAIASPTDAAPLPPARPSPLAIQILSIIFYGSFAIAVSIVAIVAFGVVGIVLAAFLAWQWGRIPSLGRTAPAADPLDDLVPALPKGDQTATENTSFNAYRDALLERLEQEQDAFHDFLHQLREAKDKAEFDQFMADRAGKTAIPGPASA
ncbi:MAG: DUF2852 domain-containing protein [Pseudomonadota bacterium]